MNRNGKDRETPKPEKWQRSRDTKGAIVNNKTHWQQQTNKKEKEREKYELKIRAMSIQLVLWYNNFDLVAQYN